MNRTLCRKAPRTGRIVVGLAAVTLVGGVSLLAGAVSKSEPAARSEAVAAPASRTVQLAARVNGRIGLIRSDVTHVDTSAMTAGQPGQARMQIRDDNYTMDLQVHSSRAANYRVYVMNGNEDKVEIEPGPVNTYRGTLVESPGSLVSASLMSDGLHGHVRFADGETYWFEGLGDRFGDDPEFDGLHVVYNDDDVIPSEGTCGTDHGLLANAHEHFQLEPQPRTGMSSSGGPEVCEIACDADQAFINRWGSGTEARINLVIDQMNGQYLQDVNIVHNIVAIVLHETNPSEYTSNDPSTLLNQFRSHWTAASGGHRDIVRDIAHLFTGRNLSGSVIGIAWLGVICDSPINGLGFGVVQSDCCGSLACATDLSAHELGHNWDAQHCGCSGWTMNSGLQCANRFHPTQTIPEMLLYIDSLPCLSDVAPQNNQCANASDVGNGTFAYTTIGSTTDGGTSSCGVISKDIWYNYTASCDGTATANLCDSDFNTRIGVYDLGDCAGSPFACNDDSCGTQSVVSWPVTEGTTYLVRVGGRSAEGNGALVLSCQAGPSCPNDLDGSGVIDFGEILAILAAWGNAGGPEDLDMSGFVDFGDILIVLGDWGTKCP